MFKWLNGESRPSVTVTINGVPVQVPAGTSVAAALLVHGERACRTTPVSGSARGPYCMMGVCHDCLVQIDGVPNRQGCRVIVAEGMQITHQDGARELES